MRSPLAGASPAALRQRQRPPRDAPAPAPLVVLAPPPPPLPPEPEPERAASAGRGAGAGGALLVRARSWYEKAAFLAAVPAEVTRQRVLARARAWEGARAAGSVLEPGAQRSALPSAAEAAALLLPPESLRAPGGASPPPPVLVQSLGASLGASTASSASPDYASSLLGSPNAPASPASRSFWHGGRGEQVEAHIAQYLEGDGSNAGVKPYSDSGGTGPPWDKVSGAGGAAAGPPTGAARARPDTAGPRRSEGGGGEGGGGGGGAGGDAPLRRSASAGQERRGSASLRRFVQVPLTAFGEPGEAPTEAGPVRRRGWGPGADGSGRQRARPASALPPQRAGAAAAGSGADDPRRRRPASALARSRGSEASPPPPQAKTQGLPQAQRGIEPRPASGREGLSVRGVAPRAAPPATWALWQRSGPEVGKTSRPAATLVSYLRPDFSRNEEALPGPTGAPAAPSFAAISSSLPGTVASLSPAPRADDYCSGPETGSSSTEAGPVRRPGAAGQARAPTVLAPLAVSFSGAGGAHPSSVVGALAAGGAGGAGGMPLDEYVPALRAAARGAAAMSAAAARPWGDAEYTTALVALRRRAREAGAGEA